MKMKEFGPPGGGARPWRPPLDPPMQTLVDIKFEFYSLCDLDLHLDPMQ